MNTDTSSVLVDILYQYTGLCKGSIWIRNQDRQIPNKPDLYIVVGFVSSPGIVGNVTYMKEVDGDSGTEQHEINEVQVLENIQIDLFSRNDQARLRKWEVIAALQSFYSQQQQEKNNFKIFRIPSAFIDISQPDGSAMLNRYSVTVTCMVWYRKDRIMTQLNSPLGDYYDDFKTCADDESTIGTDTPLIEFEITPDTPPPFTGE